MSENAYFCEMETIFEQLIGQGIMGTFLVLVIIYFRKELKDLRATDKAKGIAHAEQMQKKDDKIQELNDQIRRDAIENVRLFNDLQGHLKDLVTELKFRNNA